MTRALRIKEVERTTLRVPFTECVSRWNALLVWQWQIVEIIRVTTDDASVGYGETLQHYTFGNASDEALGGVRGRNPAELLGDDSLGAGLQMAIYDVVGKALGVPAYHLFNLPKVRDWCPIAWWNTKMGPEDLAGEAQDAVARGYIFHKIKTRPWIDVYAQVEAISAGPVRARLHLRRAHHAGRRGGFARVTSESGQADRPSFWHPSPA